MSKKGGKSTPSKGEKGDKTRTTPTNELVPGILDNEERFSKKKTFGSSGTTVMDRVEVPVIPCGRSVTSGDLIVANSRKSA